MKKQFNYFKNLALTSTAKSTYLTTFGAGINAVFGFLFNIIVARSISPSNFGLFSVVLNFATILFVICDMGLSSAVLRYLPQTIRDGRKSEINRIIKFSFITTFMISCLIAVLLIIFSNPIASNLFKKNEISLPLVIAAFSLVGLTLSVLSTSILQSQQRFIYGVFTDSSVIFLKFLFTIILLLSGNLNLITVLIIYSLTSFSGFIIGMFFITPKYLLASIDAKLAKDLLGFGVWIVIARIANVVSARIDTLMLIRYVEAAQVGFYAAAQKMTFIFPVLLNGLTVVITPKYSSFKTKNEMMSFTKKSSLLMCSLFIPMVILFFLSPWVTETIFGIAYSSASTIFRWLLISSFFSIVSSIPVLAIVYYLGQSKYFAAMSFFQVAIIFIGNLIFIPRYGVIGPAISLAVSYGLFLFISILVLQRGLKNK